MTSEVPQSRTLKSLVEPHFKETQWNPREEMCLPKDDEASELPHWDWNSCFLIPNLVS